MKKVRLAMEVSQELANTMTSLAEREGVSRTEIVRRALSVMKAFDQQMSVGRFHLGFATEAKQLDCEILGILEPRT